MRAAVMRTPASGGQRRAAAAAFAVLIAVLGGSVSALPLDPDPTFGDLGVVRLGPQVTSFNPSLVGAILVQSDGRILVLVDGPPSDGGGLWRLNADGTLDATFANGTAISTNFTGGFIAQQTDGKIVVSGADVPLPGVPGRNRVMRFMPNGAVDTTFGDAGSLVIDFYSVGIAVQNDGHLVIVGSFFQSSQDPAESGEFLGLVRLLPDGKTDLQFGDRGVLNSHVRAGAVAFARGADGALLATGNASPSGTGTLVARFSPDGQLDSTFAAGGIYQDDSVTAITARAIAAQPDGGVLIAGSLMQDQFAASALAVMRLDSLGNRDASFGQGGQVTFEAAAGETSRGAAVAVDSRRRIVVVGSVGDLSESRGGFRAAVVMRLNPDGSPDTFFAPHGTTAVWDGYSSDGFSVAIDAADRILLGGTREELPTLIAAFPTFIVVRRNPHAALFRLQGADGAVQFTVNVARAIEYYYAAFDHYFVTAGPTEIADLDTGSNRLWVRTGKSFRVWTEAFAGSSSVCRFFSGPSFAPKSSHFYTPYPSECAALKAGTAWAFEGEVFELQLPQGTLGQGTCSPGTAPLYRLYNNGQGGAPNHRYTDDLTILEQMLAQGWIFEGEANTMVFACIPQ